MLALEIIFLIVAVVIGLYLYFGNDDDDPKGGRYA